MWPWLVTTAQESQRLSEISRALSSPPAAARCFMAKRSVSRPHWMPARQGSRRFTKISLLADHLDVPANIFLGREDAYDAIKIPGLPLSIPLGPFAWMKAGSMRDHAASLLEKTGVKIPDLSESLAGMSGGQRQCVAIARAAGWGKKLIIMDEPTAALGIQETTRVENIIRGLKEQKIPVIIISHNLRQVFNLVDRIWVFRQGTDCRSPENLRNRAQRDRLDDHRFGSGCA